MLCCIIALVTLQTAVLSERLSARSLTPEQQVVARDAFPDLYEASVAELQVRHGRISTGKNTTTHRE